MSDDDLRDFFDVVEGLRYKYEALLRLIGASEADDALDVEATAAPTDGWIIGTVIDTDNTGEATVLLNTGGELTTDDIGLTPEQAAGLRMMFGAMAEDWDDPSMDAYDEL